jgi:proline dehydrogenase
VALLDRAIVHLLPAVPRPLVRRLSSRYIAGPELADAVRVIKEQNAAGKLATIDVLGEETRDEVEARAIAGEYEEVLATIERERLDSNVSVKLTALGLRLGRALCRENVERVIRNAAARGNFVRIEMEDVTTTDDTLALYRELRENGHENIGIVLQASLRRTPDDVRALADLRPNVRLCKGIYVESPDIQLKDFDAVRAAYVDVLDALLDAGAYPAIATHDEWVIERAVERVRNLDPNAYEFQMLLGVRPELGDRLVADGHRLRIYVPYGRQWYEYSLRRLQENPKIAGYVAADMLGRLVRGRG